jgi:hypothetical protein
VLGVTVVDPLADVEVNPPGLMPMLVAPLVVQLSVLLPPAVMLARFAVNELIVGFGFVAVTVTVAVLVTEPALLVAVSVYVVVALGVTVVEPLADVDVNPPGLMPMLVAPLALQFNVLLVPVLMLDGLAAKELIVGMAVGGGLLGVFETPAQFERPIMAARTTKKRACDARGREDFRRSGENEIRPAEAPDECRLEKFKSLIRRRLAGFLIARVSIRKA